MPLDRMQSQIGFLLESMDELDRLVEKLTQRVVELEAHTRVEGEGRQDESAEELEREPEPEWEQAGRRAGWWRC